MEVTKKTIKNQHFLPSLSKQLTAKIEQFVERNLGAHAFMSDEQLFSVHNVWLICLTWIEGQI